MIKSFFYISFFILTSSVLFSQELNFKNKPEENRFYNKNKEAFKYSNKTYTFCDTDNDGFLAINFDDVKGYMLSDFSNQFGISEGIYICTNTSKIYLVTGIGTTPQINLFCYSNSSSSSMLDIAINQNNQVYVAQGSDINLLDQNCVIQSSFHNSLATSGINSLSFDRSNNLYIGGYDSKVYRYNNCDFNQMVVWHDFGSGQAAGDFVLKGNKMYVAWLLGSGGCRLYEVTVDSNTNYISHIDLGPILSSTYGLASELGNLYGVTPFQLYKINVPSMTFETLITNVSGDAWYGAAGKNEAVNLVVNVFETLQNAQNNQNPLPTIWTNTIYGGQTVYASITNTINGQQIIIPIDLVINVAPRYISPLEISHCENDINANVFDIRATEANIVGTQTNIVTTYHLSAADANNNTGFLPDIYTTTNNNQEIFVRLTNSLTDCYSVFGFFLKVLPKPLYIDFNDLVFCNEPNSEINIRVNLQNEYSSLINDQINKGNSVSFFNTNSDAFSNNNPIQNLINIQSPLKEIFVRIESTSAGCFDVGSFEINVFENNQNNQINASIQTNDWTNNSNSIDINLSNNGVYEYSLDGIYYQDSSHFENLSAGEYFIYIRNKSNCSISMKEVTLLMYPSFFTPNGDGFNDFWKIKFSEDELNMKIFIYDRYGKLLKNLSPNEIGWNGQYLGNPVPSSDYWFVVTREMGRQYRGHFTLKR